MHKCKCPLAYKWNMTVTKKHLKKKWKWDLLPDDFFPSYLEQKSLQMVRGAHNSLSQSPTSLLGRQQTRQLGTLSVLS